MVRMLIIRFLTVWKTDYGINEHLIEKAAEDGIDTIITCDNGIAAARTDCLLEIL